MDEILPGRRYAVRSNSALQCEWLWPRDELAGELAAAYQAAQKVFFVSRKNLELLERQLGTTLERSDCQKSV
ncbi:MAG: hypothetical protein ACR2G5_01200 [Pyrinomonadaceae bacterium]